MLFICLTIFVASFKLPGPQHVYNANPFLNNSMKVDIKQLIDLSRFFSLQSFSVYEKLLINNITYSTNANKFKEDSIWLQMMF